MTRGLTGAVEAAVDAEHVPYLIFVELDWPSGIVRLCNAFNTFPWNGFDWLGMGNLGRIEAIKEGAELQMYGIEMALSGVNTALAAAALGENYQGRAARVWFAPLGRDVFLELPDAAGNYASTPDSAAVSITGDIDIRVKLAPNSWATVLHQAVIIKGSHDELGLFINPGPPNTFQFYRRIGGMPMSASSASHAFANGQPKWIKVTRVAMSGVVNFYHSDDGVAWTAMGGGTDAGGISDDSAATLNIGFRDAAMEHLAGKVYYAEVRNGIDGPVVAKFDPEAADAAGKTSFTSDTGEVWTVNQSGNPPARILDRGYSILADPVGPFKYRMDVGSIVRGANPVITITAESPMADYDRPRIRRWTAEDQRAVFPDDSFFDRVPQMQELEILFALVITVSMAALLFVQDFGSGVI